MSAEARRSAVVFGARNLGRAVIENLAAEGWSVVGIARSEETLAGVARAGAVPLAGDVTDRTSVREALEHAASLHGRVELVVNAAAAYGGARSGPFGGGPLSEASAEAFEPWAAAPARAAFTFLSTSAAFLRAQGGAATVIQVTGGSARRAMPGRGLWAAGAAATRALSQAAANELKPNGVHAALLVCDGSFGTPGDDAGGERIDPVELAKAIQYLHEQGRSAWTHELVVTPVGDRWTP